MKGLVGHTQMNMPRKGAHWPLLNPPMLTQFWPVKNKSEIKWGFEPFHSGFDVKALGAKHISNHDVWHHFETGGREGVIGS